MISYRPLHKLMRERGMSWEDLRIALGFSSATSAKLHRGVPVNLDTIDRLCRYFGCRVQDVMEYEE